MSKEQNFISAVIYMQKDKDDNKISFFKNLLCCLDEHFEHFEIILVNNAGSQSSFKEFEELARKFNKPLTIIKMSLLQTVEQCMNAGLDAAIGDYIYEFDCADFSFDINLVWQAYQEAIQGNDIVNVCPKQENKFSKIFYKVFNANSKSVYKLRTTAFRIVSRRALNRVHSINKNLPYRKAAYAVSGLKISEIFFEGSIKSDLKDSKFDLAVDALVLYTDFGYKFSLKFALIMMFVTMCSLFYALIIWLTGRPVEGWTTTMCAISFGFTGLFAMMVFILKYLVMIVRLIFNKNSYLTEGLEKKS